MGTLLLTTVALALAGVTKDTKVGIEIKKWRTNGNFSR
jgi:hypothetical protein